jgi:hypothetical protein
LFVIARSEQVSTAETIHSIVSIGIAVAVLTLAWLEHRAHRDG